MAQTLKTKSELESLVREKTAALPIHHLQIIPDPIVGWVALVVAEPHAVGDLQGRVDLIATELRAQFGLKEET